jgi:hypothetical protein
LAFSSLGAASAAAMFTFQTAMVFVAGGICCVNATSLIHRQNKLNGAPGMYLREQIRSAGSGCYESDDIVRIASSQVCAIQSTS